MGMAHSIKELRRLSDGELIRQHDEAADRTLVGTGYLGEIRRRESDRRERRMELLTWANVGIATVAAIAAVIVLFRV